VAGMSGTSQTPARLLATLLAGALFGLRQCLLLFVRRWCATGSQGQDQQGQRQDGA